MTSRPAAPPVTLRFGLDKAAFLGVFVLGVAAIISLDMAGLSKLVAVIICIALISLYAAGVLLLPRLRLRPDQAADNSYYMGLLFTLTSLGVALFRFASTDFAAQSILRNFGIAIFTTIWGLMLRVFISQFREDPEDFEYEAKEALAETVKQMRGELDQALTEMKTFAVGVTQALNETVSQVRTSTTDALTTSLRRFDQVSDQVADKMVRDGERFGVLIAGVAAQLDAVIGALEQLAGRIDAVEVRPDAVTQTIGPAFEGLVQTVGGIAQDLQAERSRIARSVTTLSKLGETLQQLDDATSRFSDVSVTLQRALGPLQDINAALGDLEGSIRSATAATKTLADAELSAGRLAATLEGLNTEFSDSQASVERVRRELAELAGWIMVRLDKAA